MKKSIYLLIFVCCTYASIAQNRPIYISVEDMINNFRENKSESIDSYNFIYSNNISLMKADSLLPQTSFINPNLFKGVWKLVYTKLGTGLPDKKTLYLRSIEVGKNTSKYKNQLLKDGDVAKLYDMQLVKRVGEIGEVDTYDMVVVDTHERDVKDAILYKNQLIEKYGEDSLGIPAIWFSGEITLLDSPQDLFGEIVSKYIEKIILKNGEIVSSEGVHFAKRGEMEGAKITEIGLLVTYGVTWHDTAEYALSELDTFVNKDFQSDQTSVKSGEYSILLVTNESGEADGYLLEPEKLKSKEEKQLINKLLSKIESLPLWSFGWLYTIDGSIFQGRYIKATYSSDLGWHFIDYVMILDENQNISE